MGTLYARGLQVALRASTPTHWTFDQWLVAAAFFSLTASVLVAAWSIHPRFRRTQDIDHIYWSNILTFESGQTFWTSFHGESPDALERNLAGSVYTLEEVCKRKYLLVRAAIWTSVCGGVLDQRIGLFGYTAVERLCLAGIHSPLAERSEEARPVCRRAERKLAESGRYTFRRNSKSQHLWSAKDIILRGLGFEKAQAAKTIQSRDRLRKWSRAAAATRSASIAV